MDGHIFCIVLLGSLIYVKKIVSGKAAYFSNIISSTSFLSSFVPLSFFWLISWSPFNSGSFEAVIGRTIFYHKILKVPLINDNDRFSGVLMLEKSILMIASLILHSESSHRRFLKKSRHACGTSKEFSRIFASALSSFVISCSSGSLLAFISSISRTASLTSFFSFFGAVSENLSNSWKVLSKHSKFRITYKLYDTKKQYLSKLSIMENQ